jgi:mono/diheme cytochrome c family protein
MNRYRVAALLIPFFLSAFVVHSAAQKQHDAALPFGFAELLPLDAAANGDAEGQRFYEPKNPYAIFINYELGMHCVGFDVSYCCIIPPYNSVQAQAVRSGMKGAKPRLLSDADGIKLHYAIEDNSYSEGNKMKYWQVLKDVDGNGSLGDPGDNVANYVWKHLFIYTDLAGSLPADRSPAKRLHVGRQIPVNVDSGPSGKSLAGGYLDHAPPQGGNIVFTDSLLPGLRDVPLTLTAGHLWDALGLPLTAFNDSTRKGSIRTITDADFQPYQKAVVQLRDKAGKPVLAGGRVVEFFGTEPVDISNCQLCHSQEGKAARLSRQAGAHLFDQEYDYWKKNYPDASEYAARLSSATINILELHDRNMHTGFLKNYDAKAASNRIGDVGSVNCTDCHGDNISGNLQSPRPGATGYQALRAKPLTEAVHAVHALTAPMPDGAGRTQSCQVCHPMHWQIREFNDLERNPYAVADGQGNPRFSKADLRTSGGGCYLRRDAHANPAARPPFFLNAIGKWYLKNVAMTDEKRKPAKELRGLYCTNCHNGLSHALYEYDDLADVASQKGKTLRNRPVREVIDAVAGGDARKFADYFADPTVAAAGNPLHAYYADHRAAILAKAAPGRDNPLKLLPWNGKEGASVFYAEASGGKDWWLSPGEPHCADCHRAPFVESEGGKYFPIDQPGKYALYRYSKAHGALACQSCHESMHGLYPVREEGAGLTVDRTSREQALQFSPDGRYAGPVTCAACHTVNAGGVAVQLAGTGYAEDYWAAVVLIHFMREGDQELPIYELVRKYPAEKAREVFWAGEAGLAGERVRKKQQ